MSSIFGHLNISDSDRVFNATIGQRAIFDAANEYVIKANAELMAAMSVFLEETTDEYKRRYKLPGSGYLQQRNVDGSYGTVKATGQWDVAFPLHDYGAQIAGNDVDMAYMTVAELDRHLKTVVLQNVNTVRFEILKALLDNAQDTFADPAWGDLSIEPLANGDAVVYPPVLGSSAEATDNHYLESGYVVANMSATNDPFNTIRNEIEEHFGVSANGSDIITFAASDVVAKARALGTAGTIELVPVTDKGVNPGQDTATLRLLSGTYPGILVGRVDGIWLVEWRWLPSTYTLSLDTSQPKPLIRRIDPADTGLGDGLQLVAMEELFPFKGSFWRHRFGLGVGNRLNGVALEVAAGGTYTVPTAYD